MKGSRVRNYTFAFIAISGSLSLLALTGEITLRLFGYHGAPQMDVSGIYQVDDPILDWRQVPNVQVKRGMLVYKYNSSGFRDLEHTVDKPLGVTRLVVAGDSVTEGYGVQWTSVFSSRIQSTLGDKFEVITIAAGGLNTPQEVHLFEQEGLPYRPDLVVLNFVLNDCDFYTRLKAAQHYADKQDAKIGLLFDLPINPRIKRLLKSSAFVYFVKERLENLKGRILEEENADYYSSIWNSDANRLKVTSGFNKLESLKKEHHFDVVVIIWPLITDYRNYGFQYVHEWVKEQAESRGFVTIDLLPKFSKIPYRDLQVTSEDNVHPNALGHSIASASFLTWYRSRYGEGI